MGNDLVAIVQTEERGKGAGKRGSQERAEHDNRELSMTIESVRGSFHLTRESGVPAINHTGEDSGTKLPIGAILK